MAFKFKDKRHFLDVLSRLSKEEIVVLLWFNTNPEEELSFIDVHTKFNFWLYPEFLDNFVFKCLSISPFLVTDSKLLADFCDRYARRHDNETHYVKESLV